MGKVEIASSAKWKVRPPRNDTGAGPSVASQNDEALSIKTNEDVKKLLDLIAEIIANEYIEIAKKNKDVFKLACESPCPISEGKGSHSNGGGK